MSHTTEAEYKKQLEELRELHRQAVEETQKVHDQLTLAHNQKDLDDVERGNRSTETADNSGYVF